MKKVIRIGWQVALLTLLSEGGTQAVERLRWPVPGPVLGLVALFILLQTGIVKLDWVEAGASWLLADMLLFFIPSAVGIVQYPALMVAYGARILLVIAVSTVAVMACTGLLAEWVGRRREVERS